MAARYWETITAEVNYWARYRSPDPANYVDKFPGNVQLNFRRHNYVPAQDDELEARDLDPAHRQFLDKHMPQLQDNPAEAPYWKGTKYLGEGSFGQVGLWEFQHPDPKVEPYPAARQVAVKEGKMTQRAFGNSLLRESNHHLDLRPGGSPHIVSMLLDPPPPERILGADEGLGPEWDGIVRRIYLEYCPLGTLDDLLVRRIRLGVEFSELVLWRMFDCLVDGACALEYCYELRVDPAMRAFIAEPIAEWIPKVHFDLKPENIFLSDRRNLHPDHPLCKEQFTERWDHADWQQSNFAGAYGAATNVWGIGCIMFQLVILTLNPPDHRDPYLPDYEIDDAPPKGITYGVNLNLYPYSDTLKDLVQECLYDDPSHRPSLPDLKRRIYDGMESCIQAGDPPEPWVDFLPAEPPPPAIIIPPQGATQAQKAARRQAQQAARRQAQQDKARQALTQGERNTRIRQMCTYIKDDDTQCQRTFLTLRGAKEVYCWEHRE
ncbi:kinase-like protein [Stipitochalara longipes BDJ]|nr:kinase-like protein [Stipitochalara longipes BDJ]